MPPSLELATSTPDETKAAGEALAELIGASDVVSLTGDLGAGKTTLVQGIARGLGVEEPVLSPTFTLVREYDGRRHIYHLDVYRLERLQDVMDLGFEEMLDRRGVVLIEWGDAIEALLPESYLQLELRIPDDDEGRRIAVTGQGPAWATRWERLEQVLLPWTKA